MNERYLNVLKRLYMSNKFITKKVDLNNIHRACQLFNNPHQGIDYIHVTGTNGKGSVCKKLSETFIKSGMKTGMFISPHISTFRERIQINNQMITKEYIVEEMERIYKIIDHNQIDLSYFEFVTLLCFNYYRDEKIDIGVVEVGLGGNLDATNVVDPLISIITSIGLDHMEQLGNTVDKIAEKKAGIIKMNRPCLIGVDCNPKEIFINKANKMNSRLYQVEDNYVQDFEIENNNIVRKSIDVLKLEYPDKFKHINEEHISYGLKQRQPCRKEDVISIIGKDKFKNLKNINKIFLDVAHNPHAIEKLLVSLREEYINKNLIVICGFSQGKDKNEMFKLISSYADQIYFVTNDHVRITKYDDMLNELNNWLLNYYYDKSLFYDLSENNIKGDIRRTIEKVFSECNNSDKENVIVICGSFFIMKDVRKSLNYIEDEDPVELNEINYVKFK